MPAIGNTPLIKLERLPEPGSAEIYIKYEGANPTGSMKDRMALSMIEGAEKRGQLKAGGRVMDYTGGSTGSSLAMVCATKGYQAHFVSSDAFAQEKLQTMRIFGATLEIFPSDKGKITANLIDSMVLRAKELSLQPNTFWTDQFNNVDNRNAYHVMAREVISVLGNSIDEFIMGVGTGDAFPEMQRFTKKKHREFVVLQLSQITSGRFQAETKQAVIDWKGSAQDLFLPFAGSTWPMKLYR